MCYDPVLPTVNPTGEEQRWTLSGPVRGTVEKTSHSFPVDSGDP